MSEFHWHAYLAYHPEATAIIKDLFLSGYAFGVHLYTLNREVASVSILKVSKHSFWSMRVTFRAHSRQDLNIVKAKPSTSLL